MTRLRCGATTRTTAPEHRRRVLRTAHARPEQWPTPWRRLDDDRDPSDLAEPPSHQPAGVQNLRTKEVVTDMDGIALSRANRLRWNGRSGWV